MARHLRQGGRLGRRLFGGTCAAALGAKLSGRLAGEAAADALGEIGAQQDARKFDLIFITTEMRGDDDET